MPDQSTYRRRKSVTLLRAGASVVGFDLALFAAHALSGHLGDLGPFGQTTVGFVGMLEVLSLVWWLATLIPLGWAILGGAVVDHKLARRGPWWPMLVHPLGLTAVSVLIVLVLAVVEMVSGSTPLAFLAFMYLMPVPFLGIAGVFATWLIPGSFPAYVPHTPVHPVVKPLRIPASSTGHDGPRPHRP